MQDHEERLSCRKCGREELVMWLAIDGSASCTSCALEELEPRVQVATKPEARDDGR